MKHLVKKAAILFFTMVGLMITVQVEAQQNQHKQKPPRPVMPDSVQIEKMVSGLSVKLELSTEQQKKFTELHKAHFTEARKLMEKGKQQHEKHREMMDALRKEFEGQVNSILNKEQKAKFENFLKEHKPGKGRPKH